ncbi:hypothetical protein GCM10010502_67860 [Kitasatospora aureofaciens]|uniref:Uncharacterized protein n=1 Tax=Kitasatospora aureofaciens TaxID=1894 RepID=A0A8H9I4U3_KITAU|nr:hypothetical protein GCM10010502_67860 [Kitasatospora aureofaciens]
MHGTAGESDFHASHASTPDGLNIKDPSKRFDGVHRLAADYRHALAEVPGLALVPDRWLHLPPHGRYRPGPSRDGHAADDEGGER